MSPERTGGCLCGALRFVASADPTACGYCHCRLCRRSTGAPVLVWVTFPKDRFAYRSGTPARFASSDHGVREFCGACGTQIAFVSSREPAIVEVNVGAMDHPQHYVPQMHVHCESAIPWLRLADGLPRYEGSGPPQRC